MIFVEVAVRIYFLLACVVGVLLLANPNILKFISVEKGFSPSTEIKQPEIKEVITLVEDGMTSLLTESIDALNPKLIELNANNNKYLLALVSSDPVYLKAKALEFCAENFLPLKLEKKGLIAQCVEPVFKHFESEIQKNRFVFFQDQYESPPAFPQGQKIVKSERSDKIYYISIPLANGENFIVKFDSSLSSPQIVSETFCRQKSQSLNLKTQDDLVACVTAIQNYMTSELTKFEAKATAEKEVEVVATDASIVPDAVVTPSIEEIAVEPKQELEPEPVKEENNQIDATKEINEEPIKEETPSKRSILINEYKAEFIYDNQLSTHDNAVNFCQQNWSDLVTLFQQLNLVVSEEECPAFIAARIQ